MLARDPISGKLLHQDEPDTLIGTVGIMGVGLNLQLGTIVILCKPVYVPQLSQSRLNNK